MEKSKMVLLENALQICNKEDRSTEYTIQFMQDYADVDFESVIEFLKDSKKTK